MHQMGLRSVWVKPKSRTAVHPDFSKDLHNVLRRRFNPERPNAVWCTDITYIWIGNRFVYLTSIMDLFSRKIISWKLSQSMDVRFVIEAVEKAREKRKITEPLIIHSDRGSQYLSKAYMEATKKMTRSYSRAGTPYDNACIESFHALIKREWLNRFTIRSYSQAYALVFDYIEAFYNTVRIHGHCGYQSPNTLEALYAKNASQPQFMMVG